MTTIAYKSSILATDTQMTDQHVRVPMRKLFLLGAGQGCVAICGDVEKAIGVVAWIKAGADPSQWKKKLYKGVAAIYIDKWGEPFWFDDGPNAVPIVAPHYAMGTGGILAMGAMSTGLSAIEAVKFASTMDIYTNDKIEYYSVKTGKIKKA